MRVLVWDLRDRLGKAPAVAGHEPDGPRRAFDLELPAGSDRGLSCLRLDVPAALYVPGVLEERGLGGYEPEALACFLAALEHAGPGAVLDVGANSGVYCLLAAAMTDRRVLAFEPVPDLASAAEAAARDNGLDVDVRRVALGRHRSVETLYLSESTDSSNSLLAGFRRSTHQLPVRVETLDGLVRRQGVVPAVVKIDTEATEPDVLAGARRALRRHRPWILCEVLAGRVEERLMHVLAGSGYRLFHIAGVPPFPERETIVGDPRSRDLMWLFAPEEPTTAFWDGVSRWQERLGACVPGPG